MAEEIKSSTIVENRVKDIFEMTLVGAGAGFFLASFDGYFRPAIIGATRAAIKDVWGSVLRYSAYGGLIFGGYAVTQEMVVTMKGERDWWAPFISGSVVGLLAAGKAGKPAWPALTLGLACGGAAAVSEGFFKDQVLFNQARWVQLEDQEEVRLRQTAFLEKNREENSRRLLQVEREAMQSLTE